MHGAVVEVDVDGAVGEPVNYVGDDLALEDPRPAMAARPLPVEIVGAPDMGQRGWGADVVGEIVAVAGHFGLLRFGNEHQCQL